MKKLRYSVLRISRMAASAALLSSFGIEALRQLGRADEAVPVLLALAQDVTLADWVRREAIDRLVEMGQVDNLPTQQRPWWSIFRFR